MGKWEMVRLGDVCRPKQWKTISTAQLIDSGYPVYGANGKIGYFNEYTHEKETVLVTCRGATCGTVNICGKYSYVNGNAMALDDLSSNVNLKYMAQYLRARGLSDIITGSAQPQIIRSNIEKIYIPIPPLDVQQQIANVLDKASALIEMRKAQMDKLDLLIKSQFIEMFELHSWETELAGSIMFGMRNGVSPSKSGEHYEKVLTLSAITQGSFDSSAWKDGLFDYYPSGEKRISSTDFYICRGNGNKALVGTGVYSMEDRPDLVFPDTVIAAHVDEQKVCLPYLCNAWKSPSVRSQIEASARTTNGTYKINQNIISNIEVTLPPLSIQYEFADFVAQVDKSKFVLQQSLEKLELNYKSLMQKCFRGEIF